MNLLENANVFCINSNGVAEGCHFLTLVTCRPSLSYVGNDVKRRSRANSLPPSLEVFYESDCGSSERKCRRKVYDLVSFPPTPIRSLSEDGLRPPRKDNLTSNTCLKCISNIMNSFEAMEKKKNSHRRLNVTSQKRCGRSKPALSSSGSGGRVVSRPKMHKYMISHQRSQFGCQYSGAVMEIDGYMLSYFISELKRSRVFRSSFIKKWSEQAARSNLQRISVKEEEKKSPSVFLFVALMKSPEYEMLDLLGNKMVNSNILYRRSLEHALSWLSTLGGAFSALGDLSPTYAEEAGHVSITQLRIAMKLDDPGIQSRCRLYAAISLLQRGYLKSCRDIVRKEYAYAMSLPEGSDPRLRRMCLGIWAKLQYHWKQVVPTHRSMLRSTKDGLRDIECNSKYRNVYNLEVNRKIVSYETNENSS